MRNGTNDMPKSNPPRDPEQLEEDEDAEELININLARHRHALIPEVQRFYAPAPPRPVIIPEPQRAPAPQRAQHANQFFDYPGQGRFYDLARGPPYFLDRERHNGRDRPMPPGEQRIERGEQRGGPEGEQRERNVAGPVGFGYDIGQAVGVGHGAGNLAQQARIVVGQGLALNVAGVGHGAPIPGGIAQVVVQRDPELGNVQPENAEQGAARARGRARYPARDAAGNRMVNGQQ